MRTAAFLLALLLVAPSGAARAAAVKAAAVPYRAAAAVSGEIRIWGSPVDRSLVDALVAGFVARQPAVGFSAKLYGPESTIAGVYTGVADIAIMARELREPMERMAFEWARLAKPFVVEIATAGLDAGRPSSQLAVYVHKNNPINALSLTDLDAVFGAERKRGGASVESWTDLGLSGGRPVRAYGPKLDSIPALFFRRLVMKDSRKWKPGYRELGSDEAVIDALKRDPDGIAFAPYRLRDPALKIVALSEEKGTAAVSPTRETVISRTYPLTRVISVVLHRESGKPVDPKLKEFLRFVLSAEGQAIIDRNGTYFPLSDERAQQELARLD